MFVYTIRSQGTKEIYITIHQWGGEGEMAGAFDKITYSFMAISQGLDKLIKIGEEGGL